MAKKYNPEEMLKGANLFGGDKPPQSFSELFGMEKENKNVGVEEIAIEKLHPSLKNPFSVEMNEDMEELISSIKENGILVPIIVREYGNQYEIIAGHRRHFAATQIGLSTLPAIVMDMTEEQADIIMVDSNLNRPNIRISERAFAYKLKYEAIKKKVGRNWDIKSNGELDSPLKNDNSESNWEPSSQLKSSAEIIAEQMGVSDKTIKDYIRLTLLEESLLELVDKKMLQIKAGVQLSYLPSDTQNWISGGRSTNNPERGRKIMLGCFQQGSGLIY